MLTFRRDKLNPMVINYYWRGKFLFCSGRWYIGWKWRGFYRILSFFLGGHIVMLRKGFPVVNHAVESRPE